MTKGGKSLRDALLYWHNNVDILDLLDMRHQKFRHLVSKRIGKELDFREAIEQANEADLQGLDIIISNIKV